MSVGIVVDGCSAPWCLPAAGRRSCFNPCMRGGLGVGRPACGLSMVGLWFLQRFFYVFSCVSRLTVRLFCIGSFALQPVPVHPVAVHVVVSVRLVVDVVVSSDVVVRVLCSGSAGPRSVPAKKTQIRIPLPFRPCRTPNYALCYARLLPVPSLL